MQKTVFLLMALFIVSSFSSVVRADSDDNDDKRELFTPMTTTQSANKDDFRLGVSLVATALCLDAMTSIVFVLFPGTAKNIKQYEPLREVILVASVAKNLLLMVGAYIWVDSVK